MSGDFWAVPDSVLRASPSLDLLISSLVLDTQKWSYVLCPRSPLRVECQADSNVSLFGNSRLQIQFQTIFVDLESHSESRLTKHTTCEPNLGLFIYASTLLFCAARAESSGYKERTHGPKRLNDHFPALLSELGHPCSRPLWDVASRWWNQRETVLWGVSRL